MHYESAIIERESNINMKYNLLGKTNLKVSEVGLGCLTMGFEQLGLSPEEGSKIILHAVKRGINFLDTAQYYDTYKYMLPALIAIRDSQDSSQNHTCSQPRLPFPIISSRSLTSTYEGMVEAVQECLAALQIEKVDIFGLHEVRGMEDFYARSQAWRALQDMKKAGKVGYTCVTTHHQDVALAMAEQADCDTVFALINKEGLGIRQGEGLGRAGSAEAMAAAIEKCAKAGKGVFTMKAFGGGNLIHRYTECLDYAKNLPGNQCVMMGMGTVEEVDAAVAYFDGYLAPDYKPDTNKKSMRVDQSDCEGCGTCIQYCNSRAIAWNSEGLAEIDPDKCVHCGYCAPQCPVRAIIFA